MTSLQYPIGKFEKKATFTAAQRAEGIEAIAAAPGNLRAAVNGLSAGQLDTPYRPDGWTIRQVVHHVPDSHINSYTRYRLALTEAVPVIKPYEEARWAELSDACSAPVEVSLALLESLHARWVPLLRSLSDAEWKRTFRHPDLGTVSLENNAALYAWHGRHHVAHITALRQRLGW